MDFSRVPLQPIFGRLFARPFLLFIALLIRVTGGSPIFVTDSGATPSGATTRRPQTSNTQLTGNVLQKARVFPPSVQWNLVLLAHGVEQHGFAIGLLGVVRTGQCFRFRKHP